MNASKKEMRSPSFTKDQRERVREAFEKALPGEKWVSGFDEPSGSLLKFLVGGASEIIYCLSAGLLFYGIAKIIGPILTTPGQIIEKLACVGAVNLYGAALVAAAALVVTLAGSARDAVFLCVLWAVLVCAGGIVLEVTATDFPYITLAAAAACAAAGFAEWRTMIRKVGVSLRGALSIGVLSLIIWNMVVACAMGLLINLLDGGEYDVPPLMRQFWILLGTAIFAVGSAISVEAFKTGRTANSTTSKSARLKSAFSPALIWTLPLILLAGSIYHWRVLCYAFNIEFHLSDFMFFALPFSATALGLLSRRGRSNGTDNLRLAIGLAPLTLALVCVALGRVPTDAGWNLNLLLLPFTQMIVAGAVIGGLFLVKRWKYADIVLSAHIVAATLICGARTQTALEGINLEAAGVAATLALFAAAVIHRHPLPAVLAAILASIGLHWTGMSDVVARSLDMPSLIPVFIILGLLLYSVAMIFKERMNYFFVFTGNAVLAAAAMFARSDDLTLPQAFILSVALLALGLWMMSRLRHFPVATPLIAPFPIVASYVALRMSYWLLVVASFIFLAFGVLATLMKNGKGGFIIGAMETLGFKNIQWKPWERERKGDSTTTLLVLAAIGALALSSLSSPTCGCGESAYKIACTNNLKQIGLSLRLYANVYDDQYPPYDGVKGLELLRKEGFLENPKIFTCPSTKLECGKVGEHLKESTVSYVYVGGLSWNDPADTILAYDKPNNHDKFGNVLFVDGHVKGYAGANWLECAKKDAESSGK